VDLFVNANVTRDRRRERRRGRLRLRLRLRLRCRSAILAAMRYLSLDVEASGPTPGIHYLVSIGAVPVARGVGGEFVVEADRTFYVELQPLAGAAEVPEAMAVHGITRAALEERGLPPAEALARFAAYVDALGEVVPAAWPASFDHPWVSWYAQRFLERRLLGWSCLDIGSYAMGVFGLVRRQGLQGKMEHAGYVRPTNPTPHHALADAVEQGETLAWLLNHARAPAPG
jgi:DNA polymerase III epsilon subunit-like protein